MVYSPREDSYLLKKHVEKYAKGTVLDMGTGSGIQAESAAKKATSVYAVDKDPSSIAFCKENVKERKIKFVKSDLFSFFAGRKPKFDLIIFNPPYLPDHPKVQDIALDGGKKGYELLNRFLDEANLYLKKDGIILIVFSSLTKKDKVIELIDNNCLEYSELDTQRLFFEELYVFLIEKSALLKELEAKGLGDIRLLAKGHRGVIYTGKYKKQKVSIKTEHPRSHAVGRIENEVRFLRILNKHHIGPKFLFSGPKYFVYEFVKGQPIMDYIEENGKRNIVKVISIVFSQLHQMDKQGINKEEMHHPVKHIITDKVPVLLDFERARFTEKPHNVTQFCQFLAHIRKQLDRKNIRIDETKMRKLAKDYTEHQDVNPILEVIK